MSRRCPCCGLPVRDFRKLAAASSNDGKTHGIVGFCHRCSVDDARLPKQTRWKRQNRALDRALADPSKYLCKTFPDVGATQTALALLRHPQYAQAMLAGLGWQEGITQPD